jgi:single-strand DNA-binding protein
MAGINKVILIGNLGKDPEIRAIEGGRKVARFTLATTETYKDKEGQRHEQTEWHNVEFWGPVAEVIERYLRKGSQVYVEGRLRTRSYQDKENQTRYITEIVGQNMTMLGGNGGGGSRPADMGVGGTQQAATPSSAPSYNTSGNEVQEDDLPF